MRRNACHPKLPDLPIDNAQLLRVTLEVCHAMVLSAVNWMDTYKGDECQHMLLDLRDFIEDQTAALDRKQAKPAAAGSGARCD